MRLKGPNAGIVTPGLAIAFLLLILETAGSLAQTSSSGNADHGRELFASAGCGGCHTLKAANATGTAGPSLDGDPNLSTDLIIERVTAGVGPMPAFGYQMSNQDIADIAAYVMQAAAK